MATTNLSGKVVMGINRGKVIIGNSKAVVKFVGGTAPDNLGNHIATTDLNMSGFNIENLGYPIYDTDATTKSYVDSAISGSISGIVAGDGLGESGTSTLFVGEGIGIKTWPNLTSVDESADFGWSGSHDFRGEVLFDSVILEATATEINQALSGIGATVTDTNLTSLTNGSDVGSTLHYHKSKYTGAITGTNINVAHNLNAASVVVKCFDGSSVETEPQTITLTDANNINITFGKSFTGTVLVLRGY